MLSNLPKWGSLDVNPGCLTQAHSLNFPAKFQNHTHVRNTPSQDGEKQERVATVMGPGMLGGLEGITSPLWASVFPSSD